MRNADFITDKEVLKKLGEALYMHKKLAEDANKAAEAVQYLKEQGVFDKCTK